MNPFSGRLRGLWTHVLCTGQAAPDPVTSVLCQGKAGRSLPSSWGWGVAMEIRRRCVSLSKHTSSATSFFPRRDSPLF